MERLLNTQPPLLACVSKEAADFWYEFSWALGGYAPRVTIYQNILKLSHTGHPQAREIIAEFARRMLIGGG